MPTQSSVLSALGFEQVQPDLSRSVVQTLPPGVSHPAILHDDLTVNHDHRHVGTARGMN
jgi:hypothetical protein